MSLGSFFGRLKVKNTFVEVGYDGDETAEGCHWKQQSEPILITDKLLGSSFSTILDAQHSNLKLGPSSFSQTTSFTHTNSFCRTASFCASVAEGTERETEWGPGEESGGIAWSDMETMVQQVTEDPCHSWEAEQMDYSRQGQGYNEVNAISAMRAQSMVPASTISLAQAILNDDVQEAIVPAFENQCQAQASSKTRRRRKRDSLIDKAAKGRAKICARCEGRCEPTFKFCQFCGAAVA
jgi:hypothetical protein